MSYPEELSYTKDHEWIKFTDDNKATIGITDYALEQLGDVVFVELPDDDTTFSAGDSFGTVESTKTVSDLYIPIDGRVIAVNKDLTENLEQFSDDPYGKGWLIKISFEEKNGELLSAKEYEEFVNSEG